METKQSARELLKECREVLLRGQADEQMAMVAGIDLFLAAPSESAMETVNKIRDAKLGWYGAPSFRHGEYHIDYTITDAEAAALIEGCGRRVPGAMIRELVSLFAQGSVINSDIESVFAKHGVVIK